MLIRIRRNPKAWYCYRFSVSALHETLHRCCRFLCFAGRLLVGAAEAASGQCAGLVGRGGLGSLNGH